MPDNPFDLNKDGDLMDEDGEFKPLSVKQRFLRDREEAQAPYHDFCKRAEENESFYRGIQMEAADEKELKKKQRAVGTFNDLALVIASLTGIEVTGRFQPTLKARSREDAGLTATLTEWIRQRRQQCDAEQEDSEAFRDMLVTSRGITEVYRDETAGPEGRECIVCVPVWEVMIDPLARRPNLADARYLIRYKFLRAA